MPEPESDIRKPYYEENREPDGKAKRLPTGPRREVRTTRRIEHGNPDRGDKAEKENHAPVHLANLIRQAERTTGNIVNYAHAVPCSKLASNLRFRR